MCSGTVGVAFCYGAAVKRGDAKLVYTSDPEEARGLRETASNAPDRDSSPASQTIRVALDRKGRGGKVVTVASGFELTLGSLADLASRLRKRCGTGGTSGQGVIEIQGNHMEALIAELTGFGYRIRTS
jgi:predicted translation initiation factor SUI1